MTTALLLCGLAVLALALFGQRLNNFSPGFANPVAWTAFGQGGPITLNVKKHSIDVESLLYDVTHTGTGGVRARLAGPVDASGNVLASLDLDLPPYAPALSIVAGQRGVALFYLSPTRFLQLPCSVQKLHFESAIESEVLWNFDTKMNALAGFFVYPPV